MSSPIGGNWKEFWLAASQKEGGGDLDLVKYHLRNGVDPNYQHPEMESTALCEAVRAGNVKIVEFLLQYRQENENGKVVVVDPTIPSAFENQTPLEIAMELQHHAIVDMILQALPEDTFETESRYCQTILVSLPPNTASELGMASSSTKNRDNPAHHVIQQVLRLGHRVVVTTDQGESSASNLDKLCKETKNNKAWSIPSVEKANAIASTLQPKELKGIEGKKNLRPTKIDTWFCFMPTEKEKCLLDTLKVGFLSKMSYPFTGNQDADSKVPTKRRVWLMIPTTLCDTKRDKQQLIWLLNYLSSAHDFQPIEVKAILLPKNGGASFWDRLFANEKPWIQEENVSSLVIPDGMITLQAINDHKLQPVPWAQTISDPDPKEVEDWKTTCQPMAFSKI